MRILIVDDWQERHTAIKAVFAAAGCAAEFTHRYAPFEVRPEDFGHDVMFLDHDMCVRNGACPTLLPAPKPVAAGGNGFDPRCGCPTGHDLALWLAEQSVLPHAVVHSANYVGGKRMGEVLLRAGHSVHWSPIDTWDGLLPSTLFKMWGITCRSC